jgi:hypothetical protein
MVLASKTIKGGYFIMRKIICLGILALVVTAIAGCGEGACQRIGAYELCVYQQHALCLDIYPKCAEE